MLTNGGFETGDFTGWTPNVEGGSSGNLFVQPNDGLTAPTSGTSYALNPTGGNFFALSDQGGPGSYSLTQSFVVPAGASDVAVSFQLFANDSDGGPINNALGNRDYSLFANQNVEADILAGGANPFTDTVGPADILDTLYGSGPGLGSVDSHAGNPNPFSPYTFDLGALAAGTYQIRFAETDDQSFLQMGVDNVSVDATVPEPASLALLGVGLVGLGTIRRVRRRQG